jgi:hypothetical protein
MWSGVTVQTMMTSTSRGVHAALRQRAAGGRDRHIGSRHVRFRDVALADAGASMIHWSLVSTIFSRS